MERAQYQMTILLLLLLLCVAFFFSLQYILYNTRKLQKGWTVYLFNNIVCLFFQVWGI